MKNKFSLLGGVFIIAAALALVPLTAQATSYTWTGGVNSLWVQPTSPYNWSGGSLANGRSPGSVHTTYTDQATITSATNNPVTLSSAVTLGGASPALTLSVAGNSLNINSGGILGLQGDVSNAGNITINTGGTLRNGGATSGVQYILGGTGSTTLVGGGLSSLGGTWLIEQALSGYGTLSGPMINFTGGTVTANSATPLSITGAFANGTTTTHNGTVNVGSSVGSPTGVMNVDTGGTFNNYSTLNIYGTLNNNTATAVTLAGTGGTATLAGGTLGGTGAGFTNAAIMSAYGNIFTNLNNSTAASSTINATGNLNVSDITLTNAGNTTHGINLGANTLDHTTAGIFTLAGSGYTTLAGGAITNSGGGSMTSSNFIRGYGTIGTPLSYSNAIIANTAGQTLAITAPLTYTGSSTLNPTLSATAGTLLLQSTVTGGTTTGGVITVSSGAEVDLNGANLIGPTGFFSYLTLGASNIVNPGPLKLTGDSAMSNNIQVNSGMPIQVNGYTLTLNNFRGSFPSGTFLDVNNNGNLMVNGPASMQSGGYFKLGGGNINTTGATGNATDTLSGNVTGYGHIYTKLIGTGGQATASGGTLYIEGGAVLNNGSTNASMSSSAGNVLDIRSTLSNPVITAFSFASSVNPSGGTVNLDGATLASAGTNSIILGAGTVNVTNDSTFTGTINSLATLGIDSGKTLNISGGTLHVQGAGSIVGPGNVLISGSGLSLENANTLLASNFTMGPTATLAVGTATLHPLVELKGNFSFQQTNPLNWTYGTTAGLGPDLKMGGSGTALNPQTLEVGGVGNSMSNNFALNSLIIGTNTYVKLVDFISNKGTAGSEVLNIGSLSLGSPGDPTLDLDGILCYVGGTLLQTGDYNGITVIDSQVPIPPSAFLLGTGLLGLLGLGWRRKKFSQA